MVKSGAQLDMAKVEQIVGEKIVLHTLDPQAISENYRHWMQDPEVLKFLANPQAKYTQEALRGYVKAMNDSSQDHLFGIFLKDSMEHVGNIKIGNAHPVHQFADLGFIIGMKEHWGKGLATEAVILATKYAFERLKLNKMFAGVLGPNEASAKVFIKAGYRPVGRYERHYKLNNQYVDSLIFERCSTSEA